MDGTSVIFLCKSASCRWIIWQSSCNVVVFQSRESVLNAQVVPEQSVSCARIHAKHNVATVYQVCAHSSIWSLCKRKLTEVTPEFCVGSHNRAGTKSWNESYIMCESCDLLIVCIHLLKFSGLSIRYYKIVGWHMPVACYDHSIRLTAPCNCSKLVGLRQWLPCLTSSFVTIILSNPCQIKLWSGRGERICLCLQ